MQTQSQKDIGRQQTSVDKTADQRYKISCQETKQQQTPQPGAICFHHTSTTKSTSAKLSRCKHKARRRLDVSKHRSTTRQQTSVIKSVVKNPSNNKLRNLVLFVFTTRRQPNQVQLSFKDVNTKPEGDWTPANLGQEDSRPAL